MIHEWCNLNQCLLSIHNIIRFGKKSFRIRVLIIRAPSSLIGQPPSHHSCSCKGDWWSRMVEHNRVKSSAWIVFPAMSRRRRSSRIFAWSSWIKESMHFPSRFVSTRELLTWNDHYLNSYQITKVSRVYFVYEWDLRLNSQILRM